MDDFDKTLDALFAALPALDADEQLPDDAPFRRIEMDFGADTVWFEGAFEGETAGCPAGKGPRPVYLVLDGPAGDREVRAILVQYGDTRPVKASWNTDGVIAGSGLLVLHGRDVHAGTDIAVSVAARALAALRQRTGEEGHWDRAAHLADSFAEAGVDPAGITADAAPGDFAEGWLLLDNGPAGPVLGCLVDPDGYSLGPCMDADGNEVAALLIR
ncbi:hypothetical protein EH183_41840 [Streptomyces sp. CB01881]|uniref:hypothetical protein n=1 Tax=Streptomyces sp. CB01881 TaxID=2078691 RepID=UPI0011DFE21C|nr:hypothetical protein [Streptomyces sp. CB01881]TYC66542.1 hypothetical protein EH183_41840 [Streptomyces sp. CB01881]